MSRHLAVATVALGVVACNKDDEGIRGRYDLVVSEVLDTCDDDENIFTTSLTIDGEQDAITVTFGGVAVLTGFVDDEGIIQVQDTVSVPVFIQGDTVNVISFMQLQLLARRTRLDGNGRLIYDGTHPSAPGEDCSQDFSVAGQRANFAPYLPSGPVAVDASRPRG